MGKKISLGSRNHFGRNFKIIVLTGGPCGGKTSALKEMQKRLEDLGYKVYVVKEAATEIFESGVRIDPDGDLPNPVFQELKIKFSLVRENFYVEAASQSLAKKVVILMDRGVMDDLVYAGEKLFDKILKSINLSRMDVRDRRYDAVFHLHSTATISDELYFSLKDTNIARTETPAGARERNQKTLDAWIGHRHLRIIPAFEDEKKKLDLLWRHICRVLDIPAPLEVERKFLVDTSRYMIPGKNTTVNIVQKYLKRGQEDQSLRIREISDLNFPSTSMMFQTTKKRISARSKNEVETELNHFDYMRLRNESSHDSKAIKKIRTYFVYEDQYFELDEFSTPYQNLILLEIELLEEDDKVTLPPFIKVIKEVTDDPRYSNSHIAKMSLGKNKIL